MSYLDQIGVQRTRRGARRSANSAPIQTTTGSTPLTVPHDPNPAEINRFQMFSPDFNLNQTHNSFTTQPIIQHQIQPQFTMQSLAQPNPSLTTQSLLATLNKVEQKNIELKNELSLHQQKIELLEKQMLVFFGKIDRYEQTMKTTGQEVSGAKPSNIWSNHF